MSDESEHGLLSEMIRELFILVIIIGLLLAAAYFLGYWDTLTHYAKVAFNDVMDLFMTIKSIFMNRSLPGV